MKLSVIIPSFHPAVVYGGPIFTSLHTVEELEKLGIEIRVSTTNANMTTRLEVEPNIWHKQNSNIYVKYYNETVINKFSFAFLLGIWKDIKKSDIVHLQGLFSYPVPIALVYAKLFKKNVLLTPHGTLGKWCLSTGSQFKTLWLKYLIKPFNTTTVWHATADMERLEILSVFPDANVKVIANGIKIDEFKTFNILSPDDFIKKFTGKNLHAEKIIVSMGRLQKKKGFDILISSFNQVLEKHSKAKLLIAGQDEGEKLNLQNQILEFSLEEKVFLVGQIEGQDKIDFLANADIFSLPSHNENFGIVYAESLAAGTPIVASRNTPWGEVDEYNCGKWINNNVNETANAINDLLILDRETMRRNSKKLAEKYDWKNIAKEFKLIFEELVSQKHNSLEKT